ncbi:MAG: Asp23/Gls24 family envelope stress response protein [Oscillospiraceae bacterium]|nr:Asp23/Gls24 family envelope stress response protein [Oscillospiraceae bacterium]
MAENKEYMTKELENGAIGVNEDVLATIALAAVKDVEGVVSLKNDKKGLHVTLGEDSVEVECALVVLYGHSVMEIAKNVQNAVTNAIESMTGFKVTSVDVNVSGISMGKL